MPYIYGIKENIIKVKPATCLAIALMILIPASVSAAPHLSTLPQPADFSGNIHHVASKAYINTLQNRQKYNERKLQEAQKKGNKADIRQWEYSIIKTTNDLADAGANINRLSTQGYEYEAAVATHEYNERKLKEAQKSRKKAEIKEWQDKLAASEQQMKSLSKNNDTTTKKSGTTKNSTTQKTVKTANSSYVNTLENRLAYNERKLQEAQKKGNKADIRQWEYSIIKTTNDLADAGANINRLSTQGYEYEAAVATHEYNERKLKEAQESGKKAEIEAWKKKLAASEKQVTSLSKNTNKNTNTKEEKTKKTDTSKTSTAQQAANNDKYKEDGEKLAQDSERLIKAVTKQEVTSSGNTDFQTSKATVSSSAALASALKNAKCGQKIVLADGKYSGNFVMSSNCSAKNPVTLTSANGKSTITSGMEIQGSGNTVMGMTFSGPAASVKMSGKDNKVVRNRFTDWTNTALTLASGNGGEIAYNEFFNPHKWNHPSDGSYPLRIGIRSSHREIFYDAHIHHNHFYDFPAKPNPNNYHSGQSDAIEICYTGSMVQVRNVIEYNLIENHKGSSGIIDLKCGGVTARYNTILNSPGGRLDARNGQGTVLIANWIENAGGTTTHGGNHTLIGNVYKNTSMGINVGTGTGDWKTIKGKTPQSYNVRLIGNESDKLIIGKKYSGMTFPAIGTVIEGHKGSKPVLDFETNTKIKSGTSQSVPKAFKLNRSQVGVGAK